MDWLYAIVVDPFDYPQGWFGYLIVPIISSVTLAWLLPKLSKAIVVAVSVVASIILYFSLYIALYGVSSTLSIGVMFALIIYSAVCVVTTGLARTMRPFVRT